MSSNYQINQKNVRGSSYTDSFILSGNFFKAYGFHIFMNTNRPSMSTLGRLSWPLTQIFWKRTSNSTHQKVKPFSLLLLNSLLQRILPNQNAWNWKPSGFISYLQWIANSTPETVLAAVSKFCHLHDLSSIMFTGLKLVHNWFSHHTSFQSTPHLSWVLWEDPIYNLSMATPNLENIIPSTYWVCNILIWPLSSRTFLHLI